MYFRLKKQEFLEGKEKDGNKDVIKKLVWDNQPTGMLGFYEGEAVAWCAFAQIWAAVVILITAILYIKYGTGNLFLKVG